MRCLAAFILDRLEWLETIRHKYNVFLLSNTNAIHHKAFTKIYREQTGKTNFDDYFIKAYYSHDMGLAKTICGSVSICVGRAEFKADETLFIDDTLTNIEGAQKAGFANSAPVAFGVLMELGL